MRESGSISFGFTAGAKKSQRRTGHHPRSHIKNVSKHYVPRSMKNLLQILPIALCGLAGTAFASDFKSAVVVDGSPLAIHVAGDHFLVIRNFTQQEGGSTRGLVNVYDISSGQSVNVLAAAIIGTDPGTPVEVINNIVVDGPANVTVTCGTSATCFVTYRKE